MKPLILAALVLAFTACRSGTGTSAPSESASEVPVSAEARAEPTTSVEPAPTAEVPTPPEPPTTVEVLPPSEVLVGDVLDLFDIEARRRVPTLILRVADEPQPSGPIVGRIAIHHAEIRLRLLANDVAIPVVKLASERRLCTPRIARARRLHGLIVSDGPRPQSTPATYLALEIDPSAGCVGIAGIVGAEEVSLHEPSPSAVVPAALVARIQAHNEGYPPDPTSLRMTVVPEADLSFVSNDRFDSWLVTQNAVEAANYSFLFALIANGRTWVEIYTHGSDERLLLPVEQLVSGLARVSCVVSDATGSPLNMRRLPRSNSEVVSTLANGLTVSGTRGESSWIHVSSPPGGWVHNSGISCTDS